MKRRFLPRLKVIVVVLGVSTRPCSGRAAEPPNIDSVIEGIKHTEHAFFESERLNLRYARTSSVNVTTTFGLSRGEWLLGRQADGWYVEARSLDPDETSDVIVPAEANIYILRNGVSLDWKRHAKRVFIAPKGNLNVLHGWHYLENAGLNPYRQVIESTDMSYKEATRGGNPVLDQFLRMPLLPDFLETNASQYNVLTRPESVDSNTCWVVEWPGMDKLWVDVEHGCAVRRRIFHWRPEGPRARQIDNSDFREVKPGLWFCFRQIVESYARPEVEAEPQWGMMINRSTYEVNDLDLSRAPEGLTALRLPVGTMVTDAVRKIKYTVTEDEGDPFAGPLGEAAGLRRRTNIGIRVLFAVQAVLVVLGVLYYVVRRMKRGKTALLVLAFLPQVRANAHEPVLATDAPHVRKMVGDKGGWSWKPAWLEANACGPNSLFILLRLLAEDVTLSQVKDLVKCDPVLGCSMADLSNAASELGVPADILFVRPDEIARIPFPYILHGTSGLKEKTGHFIVVVGRDKAKRQLASIDPIRESFGWNPEGGIMSQYSGYLLVPRRAMTARPSFLLVLGLTLLSGGLISRWLAGSGDCDRRLVNCAGAAPAESADKALEEPIV